MNQMHPFGIQPNTSRRKKNSVITPDLLRAYRRDKMENQTQFWARFGVTQSRGSRFEMGMEIPPPVCILLNLYFTGIINDKDLQFARGDAEFERRR